MNGARGGGGSSRGLVLRFALLALVVAIPGVAPLGTGALSGLSGGFRTGGHAFELSLPFVGGVVLVGAVVAVGVGWRPLDLGSSGVETGLPDDSFPFRVCGRDLDRYRAKCPHCATREPVEER